MKMKAISEAVMWLPGFGPDEDPLMLGTGALVDVKAPESLRVEVKPVLMPKAVWPRLEGHRLASGSVAEKFQANVAAIELSAELVASHAVPSQAQREILNGYLGWGGMACSFVDHPRTSEQCERVKKLKEVLSDAEYASAKSSTLNAHFTPMSVVDAIWKGVQRLGFNGGRVLEPAAGTGHFIGGMPKELAEKSLVTAVELETVTARILKSLYGEFGVKVENKGFEKTEFPEGFFDLAISNVPFGDYQVAELRNVSFKNFRVHDYFIAKALEVVRPGGLVVAVTSAGTMDKASPEVRKYLASKADLVGAFRLPQSTFKDIAGTSVVTDVLFFQKVDEAKRATPVWVAESLERVQQYDQGTSPNWRFCGRHIDVNPYFVQNPGNVLGLFNVRSGRFGVEMVVESEVEAGVALDEAIQSLPSGIYQSKVAKVKEVSAKVFIDLDGATVKPGAYVIHNGLLTVSHGFQLEEVEGTMAATKVARIKALIPVRDAMRKLVAVQANTEDDTKVEPYRIALNVAYDKFVRKHGYISADLNSRAFREDPDFPLLLSLERWDSELQSAEKADIFYRRTVGVVRRVDRCADPAEALLTCLAESAKVIPGRIGELLECDAEEAMSKLADLGLVFVDPATGLYVDTTAYLSGNVREKLKLAEFSGVDFKGNVAALEKVIPADLSPSDIKVRIGSTWVAAGDYEAFLVETIGNPVAVSSNQVTGEWAVKSSYNYGVAVTQTWGTNRLNAYELFEMALNQQSPNLTDIDPTDATRKKRVVNVEETVAAKEKIEGLEKAFLSWIWSDEERAARLVRFYNDRFNCMVERKYNGAHLSLPGFSDSYVLHAHQKDAIWRIVAGGVNTLLAHCVGAGKTLTMICGAMESKRVGLSAKPCIVVPNHMLEQVAAEFLRAYPGANVLLASKEDMVPLRRKTLLGRIATGDWDCVVMTHSSFERISLSPEFVREHIESVIDEIECSISIEESDNNRTSVKQLERLKKVWTARLEKMAAEVPDDNLISFDELGISSISIDEAHYFKNLYRNTRLRMAGLPTNDSIRAFDMFLKTRYVMKVRGEDSGVVFATGTPVANSVAEMWTMQMYLQPTTLAKNGLHHFDAWAANFGEVVTGLELAPDGSSYRVHSRFARFANLPELMGFYKEVADIRTSEQIDVKVPSCVVETVVTQPSRMLKEYVEGLVRRAEAIKDRKVKPTEDNMLAVTTDGRKAATDLRLVGINFDDPNSKVNSAVSKIHSIWQETAGFKGTQVVFLDLSTPGAGKHWSLYSDMRDKLVELGVPQDEISFVHDAANDKATEAMFKAVREGKIRVIFGSTAKMGVGTNIQTRLVALHDIDAPWRPADVEQRRGRIVRQGNLNEEVRVYRYITAETFDAYSWQLLETKQRFIAQVTSGNVTMREIEDAEITALSFAEIKALATGNPLIMEKAKVDADVTKLLMLKSNFERQQWSNRHEIAAIPGWIEELSERVAKGVRELEKCDSSQGGGFQMEVLGKVYGDRKEAGDALLDALALVGSGQKKVVGSFGGLSLVVSGEEIVRDLGVVPASLYMRGQFDHHVPLTVVGQALVNRMTRVIEMFREDTARDAAKAKGLARRLDELKALVNGGFEHQSKLDGLLQRQAKINASLFTASAVAASDESDEVAMAA